MRPARIASSTAIRSNTSSTKSRGYAEQGFHAAKVKIGFDVAADAELDSRDAPQGRSEVRADARCESRLRRDRGDCARPRAWPTRTSAGSRSRSFRRTSPGYVEVRRGQPIPVAGGECEYTRWGFRQVFVSAAMDIVQPDTCAAGGIVRMQEDRGHGGSVRRPVRAARVGHRALRWPPRCNCWRYCRTIRSRRTPLEPILEFDRSEHPFRQAVLTHPLEHVRGVVQVPDGPGLGIEIDRDALLKYRAPVG